MNKHMLIHFELKRENSRDFIHLSICTITHLHAHCRQAKRKRPSIYSLARGEKIIHEKDQRIFSVIVRYQKLKQIFQ